jgi:hypothetical protein
MWTVSVAGTGTPDLNVCSTTFRLEAPADAPVNILNVALPSSQRSTYQRRLSVVIGHDDLLLL